MTRVHVSAIVDAPVEAVWTVMRDFNGLPKWHPMFRDSTIDDGLPSDQVGCIRDFYIKETGGKVRERLLTLCDHERIQRYMILEAPHAIENYVATLQLRPVTEGNKTCGEWSAEFDIVGGDAHAIVAAIRSVFVTAFASVNTQLRRAA